MHEAAPFEGPQQNGAKVPGAVVQWSVSILLNFLVIHTVIISVNIY